MTQFLAYLCLLILGLVNMIGLYWFAFGLWPQNWWAFFGFGLLNVFIFAARTAIK